MAAPNQNIATIVRETPDLKSFTKINNDSIAAAAKALTPAEFQVWMYLARNQDGIEWEISPKAACNEWGLKISTFHKAITTLKKVGYLVPKDEKTKTQFWFYEKPKTEQTFFIEKIGETEK